MPTHTHGPPPRTTLPKVRRRVATALLVHLTRYSHCRRPALVHMLM
ncbi:hypothetical protein ACF1BT_31095 [Methylobacterium fujisawaense]|nr:hypothetical protein [Methylorubrum sp. B1-46]UGB24881.1 hypothetical protein LPC10_18415 [Methylorubrum sp. B1-46]